MSQGGPQRIVPYSFEDFLERALGITLSPGQRVMWRVLTGTAQPGDFEGAEAELAAELFGGVDEVPLELASVAAIVKGARIGGTYFGALRMLDLALAAPLTKLAPGETGFAIIVCPDLRLAGQAFRYITGAIDESHALTQRQRSRTTTSVTIIRDDGHEVTIECLPASRGGSAIRGRSMVGALLDEAAFFRDESYTVNDAELYKAALPRIVPGGQLLVSSTPWAEAGLLYDLFKANYGEPKSCIAVKAPTRLMRTDDPAILRMVQRETERDPENAEREYEAEFMTRGAGLFFDGVAIDQAVEEYPLPQPKTRRRVSVAVDAAFVKDASALAVVGLDDEDRLRVLALDEIKPAKGSPLQPSQVVARWAEIAKRYGVRKVCADGHYREALREHLGTHRIGLEPSPEGQKGKRLMYERTKEAMNEGRLVLPNDRELLRQLREVIAVPSAGGGLSIRSPRKRGSHGDLVSALVAAVYAHDHRHNRQRIREAWANATF